MSRRTRILMAALALFVFLGAVMSGYLNSDATPRQKYQISVIVYGNNRDRWAFLREGLNQGASELPVELSFSAMAQEADPQEQIRVVNQEIRNGADGFNFSTLMFVATLFAYLWFNANPSSLMMGDAGSRAMGMVIALAALKTGSPFIYIPASVVMLVDGGLGLVKVSMKRFLHIKIFWNIRTPVHDHMRKNRGWSNTQVDYRFAIVQAFVSAVTVFVTLFWAK